jgi:hypothetical protein
MARTQIATDNFNRADAGSLGANWGDLNPNWGTSDIASNQVVGAGNGGGGQAARWIGAGSFTDDQYSILEVRALSFSGAANRIGVLVRGSADTDGSRDFYSAFVELNSAGPTYTTVLMKTVNGTETTIASTSNAWSVGDTIELEVEGTALRVFRNGTQIEALDSTDSALSTGLPGLITSGDASVAIGDNWVGGNITGGGGGGGKPWQHYAGMMRA